MENWTIKLDEIKKYDPCPDGWAKLRRAYPNHEEVHILDILKSNGIKNAMWALRCLPYKQYCLLLARIVEEIALPIWEARHPDDSQPREAVEAIRRWYNGEIDDEALKMAYAAAYASADAAYADAADAAAYASAYDAADADAYADAAYDAADAAADATAAAAYAAATAADADATAHATAWKKIKKLLVDFVRGSEGKETGW